ncbi:MAG: hypothetical protein PHH37_07020 [Paludibacter sp.]|nr:hypothetical protein [Paludibacter sp.]
MNFLKDSSEIKSNEMDFNALKIKNNSKKSLKGNLSFTTPSTWKIITTGVTEINLMPGDSTVIPVRISPAIDAIGGISYLISSALHSRSQYYSAETYVSIPAVSAWDFRIENSGLFITENNPFCQIKVRLSNHGNTNEVIRLKYDLGKLLALRRNESGTESLEFISLGAYKDTVISRTVTFNKSISGSEKRQYADSWKESSVRIQTSTNQKTQSAEILINKLNSNYENQRAESNTPLNFDYNIYNIMSNQSPRSNLNLFGSLLFENNRELQYMAGIQNIYFNTTQNFDFNRQLLYTFKYIDSKNNIQLGYNTSAGSLHSINGRGIVGTYRMNKLNSFRYGIVQNPYTGNMGAVAGYTHQFRQFSINSEITEDLNLQSGYSGTSFMAGGGFSLFKKHHFQISLLGSKAKYNLGNRDTSLVGLSYRLNYNVKVGKLEMRLSGVNTTHNYILNSGIQQYYIDGKYRLKDDVVFSLYGNHFLYSTTRYPYNFTHEASFNSNDYLRISAIFSTPKITYQIGPNYVASMRQTLNSSTDILTQYRTYQPGVWASATFRIDNYKSITPNVTLNNIFINHHTSDGTSDVTLNDGIGYALGLSYFDQDFKLNAYYTLGSTSDLYRDYLIYEQATVSRSLQVRPAYEKYIFNREAKISAFINYAYYLPAERQTTTFNVKYDHYLKQGWAIYVSGFAFANSRKDTDGNQLSSMDLNFIAGVSKRFDLQQPRQKYYNLKTVFFNDINGDRQKSPNEPPVSNIVVNVAKQKNNSNPSNRVAEMKLISDANGAINITNMPKDNYTLSFEPLVNLQSYYFLNGSVQKYSNDKSRVFYVPLVESYKVKGKIILIRDPNSSEGKISLEGVRITATGLNGETYSVLTDSYGAYILDVPNADKYTVKVINVFGENFNIDADEVHVQFTKNKTVNLDFTFIEKRREINFNGGNQLFKFNQQ